MSEDTRKALDRFESVIDGEAAAALGIHEKLVAVKARELDRLERRASPVDERDHYLIGWEAPRDKSGGWIPVSERLPSEGQWVWYFFKGVGVHRGQYEQGKDGEQVFFGDHGFLTDDVTHWMPAPLPEPPGACPVCEGTGIDPDGKDHESVCKCKAGKG